MFSIFKPENFLLTLDIKLSFLSDLNLNLNLSLVVLAS